MKTPHHLFMFFNWGTESEPSDFPRCKPPVIHAPSPPPQLPPGPGIEGSLPSLSLLDHLFHHCGRLAFGFFPLFPCTSLLTVSPLVATPLLYLFKPVLSPRPSLTRCLLCSSRFSCSSSRSSSSSSWAPPRRCRLAARSALQALRTAAAMADIKTGIFAKNVQKRLNRAQEKVSRGRRAAGQVSRRCAGVDGSAGLALQGRGIRCGALRSPSKRWVEESPVSAPSECSRAGFIQAAWARPRSGSAGNPQTSVLPRLPGSECYRLSEPAQGALLSTPSGTRGSRCSYSLASPRAVRFLGRLQVSAPASPELKLSRKPLASTTADPGGRLSQLFTGGGVVAI